MTEMKIIKNRKKTEMISLRIPYVLLDDIDKATKAFKTTRKRIIIKMIEYAVYGEEPMYLEGL